MADAGVIRDPGRLPWLEPYRAPANRKPSNRGSGATAAIGAVGLAAVVMLLTRDMAPLADEPASAPEASVVLPAVRPSRFATMSRGGRFGRPASRGARSGPFRPKPHIGRW
jgi:hypothetical protein